MSDIKSSQYGKYLNHAELAELVTDFPASRRVESWIRKSAQQAKVTVNIKNTGDFIVADLPLGLAEMLLRTQFFEFKSRSSGYVRLVQT